MTGPGNTPWDDTFDPDEIRRRIQAMSDADVRRTGAAARFLLRPSLQPPREVFRVYLVECVAEWKRRYPASMVSLQQLQQP